MRWVIVLLLFIAACNPMSAHVDPLPIVMEEPPSAPQVTSTPTVIPRDPLLTKGTCIAILKQYYGTERWDSLMVQTSRYYPGSIHLGEMVCEEEVYYQTIPVQFRSLMTRISTLERLMFIND